MHLFQTGPRAEMKSWERPNPLAIAALIAVNACGTDARVAGKVVCNYVVRLQPARNPCGLIAQRRGILDNLAACCPFDRVLIEREIVLK